MNTMAIIGFLALLDIILIVLTPDPKLKLLLGAIWREHEDVRGDDMVELGTAEQLLQEELCMLGCWDDEEDAQ